MLGAKTLWLALMVSFAGPGMAQQVTDTTRQDEAVSAGAIGANEPHHIGNPVPIGIPLENDPYEAYRFFLQDVMLDLRVTSTQLCPGYPPGFPEEARVQLLSSIIFSSPQVSPDYIPHPPNTVSFTYYQSGQYRSFKAYLYRDGVDENGNPRIILSPTQLSTNCPS